MIEALIFSSPKPLGVGEIVSILRSVAQQSEATSLGAPPLQAERVEQILEELAQEYGQADRSFVLVCFGGKWQFVTRPEYAPWLKALHGERSRPGRLSQAALETLTIIAYRQPVTRAEIEEIRGVSIDGVLQTLIERGLVTVVGRSELPGRPMLYGTTPLFLEVFGLRDLNELPAAEELRAYRPKTAGSASTQEESSGAGAESTPSEGSNSEKEEKGAIDSTVHEKTEQKREYDD